MDCTNAICSQSINLNCIPCALVPFERRFAIGLDDHPFTTFNAEAIHGLPSRDERRA